jgi:sugar phosphate permease
MISAVTQPSTLEAKTMRKVTFRIIPFLMVCYFIAFVDRVNAGFAALQMNQDIGLSSAAFGLGGGLFYITYVLCEYQAIWRWKRWERGSGSRAS